MCTVDFTKLSPDDLLNTTWLPTYKAELDALWWQIVRLNSNIFVIEKIEKFPFDLFQTLPSHFWDLTYAALYDVCVMTVWKIAIDADRRTLTLRRFKNAILANLRDPNNRKLLKKQFAATQFDKTIKALEQNMICFVF